MLDQVLSFDTQLFLFLNDLHHPVMDEIMYWISHKFFWVPLYVLFAFLLFKFHGPQKGLIMIAVILVAFALTNTISTEVFKLNVQRLRPCHNKQINHLVHIVHDHCGGQYGFFSSHASNVFALAALLGLFLSKNIKRIGFWLIIWAAIISYSRVYLGVHYPLDILCGALFGIITAQLVYKGASYFVDLKG